MFSKQWIKLLLISVFLVGCGGGSDAPPDNSSNNNNNNNNNTNNVLAPVPVTQNLSLRMTTETAVDRNNGEIILVKIRSIANDGSLLQDETVAASPANGANSSTDWSLLSDITLDQHGGRVVVNASADGFIDYGATLAYVKPNDLEFRGNMANTASVSIDIPASRLRARASGQIQDQYISLRLTTDTVTGQSRLLANKSATVSNTEVNDLGIDIPLEEIPADVTQLKAQMKGFDSSQADDNLYFPGEYADSDGNELLSIAFNFVELTDQNGRNLGQATAAARTANRLAAKNTVPTIITRTIPAGSCPSVNDLGDSNADLAGLQIPVYTYNPNSGLWDLLGYGTVTDATDVSPAAGYLDCDNVTYHLTIEVDNEDFLRSWWNLDYPLIFSEPTLLCAKIRLVDVNGDPVSGVWVSLYDDDSRSFSTQYGYTDENGEVSFSTIELDNTADRSAELRFWSYSTGSYRTETIQLSEDCASQEVTEIVLQHLDLCQVEGKTVLDTDTSMGISGTTIYAYNVSNYDFKYLTTNKDGVFRGSVYCDADYNVYSWPSQMSQTITFNVNSEVGDLEASDDGELVVLNNIMISNMEPFGLVSMSGALDGIHQKPDSLTVPLGAGTHTANIWAFDYDGHFPVSYNLQVKDNSDTVILDASGTVDDWSGSKLLQDIVIPEDGSYTISFDITDALGAVGETSIYVWHATVVTTQ